MGEDYPPLYIYGKFAGIVAILFKAVYYFTNETSTWEWVNIAPSLLVFVFDIYELALGATLPLPASIYAVAYQLSYEAYAAEYATIFASVPIYLIFDPD